MKLSFSVALFLLPRTIWRAWIVALISFASIAGIVMQWQKQAQLDAQHLLATQQRLEQFLNQTLTRPTPSAQDFLSDLPLFSRNQVAINALQRSAHEAGVAVTSLSLREAPITRIDQLGRLELTVAAQGSYSALKLLLAEWLNRFPSATVRAQQWHRVEQSGASGAGSATIEANWVLSIWTRPSGVGVGVRPVSGAASLAASAPSSHAAP